MSNIIIPKISFIKIYSGYLKYLALQRGGVDNWIWYGESLRDFKDENQEVFKEVYSAVKDYRNTYTRVERGMYNIREEKTNDI